MSVFYNLDIRAIISYSLLNIAINGEFSKIITKEDVEFIRIFSQFHPTREQSSDIFTIKSFQSFFLPRAVKLSGIEKINTIKGMASFIVMNRLPIMQRLKNTVIR